MGSMRAVDLKVLKNKLSEYVRLAQGGETILVTDRHRVVAELVSPREGAQPAGRGRRAGRVGAQRMGYARGIPPHQRASTSGGNHLRAVDARAGPGSGRPVIYDTRLLAAARAIQIPIRQL